MCYVKLSNHSHTDEEVNSDFIIDDNNGLALPFGKCQSKVLSSENQGMFFLFVNILVSPKGPHSLIKKFHIEIYNSLEGFLKPNIEKKLSIIDMIRVHSFLVDQIFYLFIFKRY